MSDRRPAGGVLLGIARLVRFRADGLAQFGATPQALLNSFAPLLAFPLVGGVLALLEGAVLTAVSDLLISTVALLAPAVLSHTLALLWRREPLWLRYIVAFNWCQSAMTLLALVAMAIAAGAAYGQPDEAVLVTTCLAGVLLYWLALGWFLAWRGLRLSVPRAILFVLALNLGTALLMIGPRAAQLLVMR